MTQDEIFNMPAGSEIDLLISKNVFGDEWPADRCPVCGWPFADDRKFGCVPNDCSMRPVPSSRADEPRHFSTDNNAMVEVAERLDQLGFNARIEIQGGYVRVSLWSKRMNEFGPAPINAKADTFPLAIARAALLAVMENES